MPPGVKARSAANSRENRTHDLAPVLALLRDDSGHHPRLTDNEISVFPLLLCLISCGLVFSFQLKNPNAGVACPAIPRAIASDQIACEIPDTSHLPLPTKTAERGLKKPSGTTDDRGAATSVTRIQHLWPILAIIVLTLDNLSWLRRDTSTIYASDYVRYLSWRRQRRPYVSGLTRNWLTCSPITFLKDWGLFYDSLRSRGHCVKLQPMNKFAPEQSEHVVYLGTFHEGIHQALTTPRTINDRPSERMCCDCCWTMLLRKDFDRIIISHWEAYRFAQATESRRLRALIAAGWPPAEQTSHEMMLQLHSNWKWNKIEGFADQGRKYDQGVRMRPKIRFCRATVLLFSESAVHRLHSLLK